MHLGGRWYFSTSSMTMSGYMLVSTSIFCKIMVIFATFVFCSFIGSNMKISCKFLILFLESIEKHDPKPFFYLFGVSTTGLSSAVIVSGIYSFPWAFVSIGGVFFFLNSFIFFSFIEASYTSLANSTFLNIRFTLPVNISRKVSCSEAVVYSWEMRYWKKASACRAMHWSR